MRDETSIGEGAASFPSTYWGLVEAAREGDPEARNRIVADYWKPIYFFARRRGCDVEAAKDATQGFFSLFFEKNVLDQVSMERGRLKSFLMASFTHYLSNQRTRDRALKRGGNLDFVQAEADFPSGTDSPEDAFFRGWAITLVGRAVERLRAEASEEDMALLAGTTPSGLSGSEKKNRIFRLRSRLRQLLRESVLPAVGDETEADSEIQALLRAVK